MCKYIEQEKIYQPTKFSIYALDYGMIFYTFIDIQAGICVNVKMRFVAFGN